MLRIISTCLKVGTLAVTAIVVLALFGAFDPWLDKAMQKEMIQEGPAWASQVTGLRITEASVVDAEAAFAGWQGDGYRSVRLQLDPEPAQTLLTQIQNDSHWEPRGLPCSSKGKSACVEVEPDCYDYTDSAHTSMTTTSSFCRRSGLLEIYVSFH